MMSSYKGRIRKLGSFLGDIVVSATGCFSLMRCFRLVASGQERPDARLSMRANDRSTKPFEGTGAALFLLAFVTSETAAAVFAFRH
jgi:hypothetical protein